MKLSARTLLKLGISALLLGWLLHKTDLSNIGHAFAQCRFGLLLAAFSLHLVGFWVSVVRWSVLLRALGNRTPFLTLLNSYLVGSFFNTFLPSTIGGDVSRMMDTRLQAGGGTRSGAVIFVERFTGIFSMILMAVAALPFSGAVVPKGFYIPQIVLGLFAAFVFFVVVVLLPQTSRLLGKESKLARFHAALAAYRHHLGKLSVAFFWGILLQVNVVFYYYLLCLGLGLHVSLLFLFILIPILKVILLFPFSVNGIGVRENGFAYFLQGVGVGVAQSLALSWLDLGMTLVFALIGGIVYVGRKQKISRA